MTTPNGPILFNDSTGADSATSGLGPGTAVSGTGASTTASSAVVTGIDTSGVSAGDLLFVDSSSGRKYSIVASVDSGSQVTCDDAFANTESGRDWAIGGKRATFDHADGRLVFSEASSDWIIETETDQTITSAITALAASILVRGLAGAMRTITQSANARHFSYTASNHVFNNLRLLNTNGTKTFEGAIGCNGNGTIFLQQCTFEDLDYATFGTNNAPFFKANECAFINCSTAALASRTSGNLQAINSRFTDCGDGFGRSFSGQAISIGNLFDGCSYGIRGSGTILALFNNFHACSNDGILNANSGTPVDTIKGNVFYDLLYGINYSSLAAADKLALDYNAFGATTSGQINGASNGANDVTLTADPFVNAATGDFNLNETAGGGALLRAATLVMP